MAANPKKNEGSTVLNQLQIKLSEFVPTKKKGFKHLEYMIITEFNHVSIFKFKSITMVMDPSCIAFDVHAFIVAEYRDRLPATVESNACE